MSGGSFNYGYEFLENTYAGKMQDAELDELINDLVTVLHDLEWWQSDDITEKQYRKSVKKFKTKWFKQSRSNRLSKLIDEKTESLREELKKML